MEKTLVILLGNARGGEETWQTMYSNLLEPFNADLALCFGKTDNKNASLYSRANYTWELPEFENWRDYYASIFTNPNWDYIFKLNQQTGLMGGIDNSIGSGAIIFAFRDFILRTKQHVLSKYDRIILTRSDYYYLDKHPITPLGSVYVTEGEDYGGITDRHHIFDSKFSNLVLGVCDFMCNEDNFEYIINRCASNPETILQAFFEHTGIINIVRRCKRVQFTVATSSDSSRWQQATGYIPGSTTIRHKYISEYNLAVSNLHKAY